MTRPIQGGESPLPRALRCRRSAGRLCAESLRIGTIGCRQPGITRRTCWSSHTAAGLWAAVTAKDEGEADVLMLEKAPLAREAGTRPSTWASTPGSTTSTEPCSTSPASRRGHTPEDIARAWAEECYQNMDYCGLLEHRHGAQEGHRTPGRHPAANILDRRRRGDARLLVR